MKPFNSIIIKRTNYNKDTGNCIGELISSSESIFDKNQIIYYKLLDKKYYTRIINTEIYDIVRSDAIFGIE